MSQIVIYEKPTCTTCRNVHQVLKNSGVDFNTVNYYLEPLNAKKLKELISKMKIHPQELFRKREQIYKDLKLDEKEVSEEEAIKLMIKYPDLLQRPIVEKGNQAILARPAEKIKEIL
jgi:arsenate reductase